MTMIPSSLPTAVRGLVCNLGPSKDDKSKDPKDHIPSVEVAKKNTEQAKLQEKAAIEKEQQQQMFTTAMDKSRNADEATKAALRLKPTSHQGRKAHQAAAVAHKDAHKHMAGVGGEKSGLANDQRAAAERKAAKHKKMAETHAAMAEGFAGGTAGAGPGPTKNATGCPGVGVELVGNVGAYRNAGSAKAEHASAHAFEVRGSEAHAAAGQAHKEAAAYHRERGNTALAGHHEARAKAHFAHASEAAIIAAHTIKG